MNWQENIVKLENVAIGYKNKKGRSQPLLAGINLSACQGELIAIVGRNGIGKSTLLRSLIQLQPVLSGTIFLNGVDICDYKRDTLSRLISFVSTGNVEISNLTVFDLISFGRMPYTGWFGKLLKKDLDIIYQVIEELELHNIAQRDITEISDGERQRAVIGRCLVQDTPVILLDEPTAFLDITHKLEILSLLKNISEKNHKAILFSSHDLGIVNSISDKIWLLHDDLITDGAPEDMVLKGYYDKIMGRKGVMFDLQKNDFTFHNISSRRIALTGDDKRLLEITRKMLIRNAYEPDEDAEEKIEIFSSEAGVIWTYIKKNHKFTFNTLYKLANGLKLQNSKI